MLVLYCIPAIPLSVTTLLALAALTAVRAVSFADALGGMLSSAVFLLAGMMVMGARATPPASSRSSARAFIR